MYYYREILYDSWMSLSNPGKKMILYNPRVLYESRMIL
jgi:hypothetical protein